MSGSSSNWKHPSAQHQQKYGLVDLPDDFVPTPQETLLLDMYKTVQTYERHAAKLKEEAARAKLAAAEEEFNKRMKPKKNPRAPSEAKQKSVGTSDDEREQGASDNEEQQEIDQATIRERRQAKLEALRLEVEEAKQQKQSEEDILRQKLLEEQEPVLDGPVLKRKRLEVTDEQAAKSLIANLTSASTPPHDFSKSLNLSVTQGRVLFPTATEPDQKIWTPPASAIHPTDGALSFRLSGFDINGQGNNTIAIKFTAPADAKRFSINLVKPEYEKDLDSVLFHFNPRQFARKEGQVILNEKDSSTWGKEIALPLSQVPPIFGQPSCTLMIQVTVDGYDVFLRSTGEDLVHVARWEYTDELPGSEFVLQFPSTDDYGNVESWTVYKVWWGQQAVRAKEDAQVTGMTLKSLRIEHPRKLFLSGLAKIASQAEADVRRAELERTFRKFGGARGVTVIVPLHATYAFIEMENEREADAALADMKPQFSNRLGRARWSKNEMLREERERAARQEASKTSNASGWD